jgi:hypothetical protein
MKTCKVYGCKRTMTRSSGLGMCQGHYNRQRRGDLNADVPVASYVRKADRKPPRQLTELELIVRSAIIAQTWSKVQ